MACYLIAGAAGYVGSHFARHLLEQGHSVRGVVLDPESETAQDLAALGMTVWTGDLTRPETLVDVAQGVDYVYNLTCCSVLANGLLRQTFVDGNHNLIAACSRSRRVQQYVFTSNVAPYGDAGAALIGEDATIAPRCSLGAVMAEAEQHIMELVREHHFPAIVLRVGSIYGPERDFTTASYNQMLPVFGSGTNYVSRIHIDDLVEILARVATEGQPGAIYNVGDDEPARLSELHYDLQRYFDLPLPPHTSRQQALRAGLDTNIIEMAAASVRLSNARLKHDLGLTLRYPSYRTWLAERLGRSLETAEVEELMLV